MGAPPPTGPNGAPPPAGANAMGAAPPPGGNAMGAAPTNGGPAVGAPPANGTAAAAPGGPGAPDTKDVKKEDPVYKKWWFWAVVGVAERSEQRGDVEPRAVVGRVLAKRQICPGQVVD